MRDFAGLYSALDETTRTTDKVAALREYFAGAPPADAAWAVWFLTGHKPRQVVPVRQLAQWAAEAAGVPDWLFAESYDFVGDLAETIALLVPHRYGGSDQPLAYWVQNRLLPLAGADSETRRQALLVAWGELDSRQAYVYNKLITGAFRVGVSSGLVVRALSEVAGLPAEVMAHRLMGEWSPSAEAYGRLMAPDTGDADISRPYPFYLASQFDDSASDGLAAAISEGRLGPVDHWQAEWKWDGIRCQLIRRAGQVFLWSRGEELITERFPELAAAGQALQDGTVLDGEVLIWPAEAAVPRPFTAMQRRVGRKTLGRKLLTECPAVMVAYDLLEHQGRDVREQPLTLRRANLEAIVAGASVSQLRVSPIVPATTWAELAAQRDTSRAQGVEGLMLKRCDSPYRAGRIRGDWWKWKIAPLTVDAVLLYAQRGHGRRAGLYSDYTFGVWDDAGQLVPIAKAYSGLSDTEMRQVDTYIRDNTMERFGPVTSVRAGLVFELAFEAINLSRRHKCGVAVRFPRMVRIRFDKTPPQADRLADIRALIAQPAMPS